MALGSLETKLEQMFKQTPAQGLGTDLLSLFLHPRELVLGVQLLLHPTATPFSTLNLGLAIHTLGDYSDHKQTIFKLAVAP